MYPNVSKKTGKKLFEHLKVLNINC